MIENFDYEAFNNAINEKNNNLVKELVSDLHPFEIAELIEDIEEDDRSYFYQLFDDEYLAEFFVFLDSDFASTELEKMKPKKVASIMEKMQLDDAEDIFREMEDSKRLKVLNLFPKEDSIVLKKMLSYDIDMIATSTNPDFIKIKPHILVKEASKELVLQAEDVENIDYIYVIEDKKLIGSFTLKKLLTTDKDVNIDEIIDENIQYLHTTDKQEDAIYLMQNYDLTCLPILNENDEMVGIVTVDDVIDIISDEVEEDFNKLAAISGDEIDKDEKTFVSVKKRIPWLLILLVIGIFTSSIIASFEATIAQVALLATFLPLVLDMAGNVGTQSLATTIRLLSTNQLDEKKEIKKHLIRELGIGLLNALVVSICVVGVVFVFSSLTTHAWELANLKKAVVIGISMALSLVVTNLIGAIIPVIISRFKIDPASASGPFITTLSDILSLLIYFGLATIWLL